MSKSNQINSELYSMTGFGEAESTLKLSPDLLIGLRVQIKSVNHRFLDISLKIPPVYSSLELAFQNEIRKRITRGRVEVLFQREEVGSQPKVTLNADIFNDVLKKAKTLKIEGFNKGEMDQVVISSLIASLWQRREILELGNGHIGPGKSSIQNEESEFATSLLKVALDELIKTRILEGKALTKELNIQLQLLESLAVLISSNADLAVDQLKTRLVTRLKEFAESPDPDDPRLLTEIAILADKIDIREELVRIRAHIEHFTTAAGEGGRKLDFIVQELGREFNTIGSKSSQAEVSRAVIEAKAVLEKIREQLQNVE
ncbi:MAG TPA: YicC family protein [Oligoflexia bacterium]|nr:YicC family protein [Oligoflexia bacterium]HMP47382.1 YicC family protein [Oligoflexia bacterium]